jgi:hypothetical protein
VHGHPEAKVGNERQVLHLHVWWFFTIRKVPASSSDRFGRHDLQQLWTYFRVQSQNKNTIQINISRNCRATLGQNRKEDAASLQKASNNDNDNKLFDFETLNGHLQVLEAESSSSSSPSSLQEVLLPLLSLQGKGWILEALNKQVFEFKVYFKAFVLEAYHNDSLCSVLLIAQAQVLPLPKV